MNGQWSLPAIACALLASVPATPALAWGATGHRLIGVIAAQSLPPELPAFLRGPGVAADVGELAREPDRVKGAGKALDSDQGPGHFLDLDDDGKVLGGPILAELPATREEYETALRAAGTNGYRAGYLPYSIVEGWQRLTKDFTAWRIETAAERLETSPQRREWLTHDREQRERQIISDFGVWAHFVGDGSQPMHVSIHFNGWGDYPNPDGFTQQKVHAPFEGAFVHDFVGAEQVRAKLAPYRDCGCGIAARTADYLAATNRTVRPFYVLEKAGGFAPADPRGEAFAAERLAAAVSELRDMTIDAWRASATGTAGYPPVTVSDVESGRADAFPSLYGED